MALTVPLMVSSGAADGMVGNAYFEENAGGRLAFDLRIAIPTVKLVEALLCYQNRLQEVVPQGQWEELPTASAEASQGIAASMSASTIAKKPATEKAKAAAKGTVAEIPPRAVVPMSASSPADPPTNYEAEDVQPTTLLVNGTGWDVPLPTDAHSLPHFTDAFRDRMRWQRRPDGLVAWNGMEPYDPPQADEHLLSRVRPTRLSYRPVPKKQPTPSHARTSLHAGPVSNNSVSQTAAAKASAPERPSSLFGSWFSGEVESKENRSQG